jgi:hypothetical protein
VVREGRQEFVVRERIEEKEKMVREGMEMMRGREEEDNIIVNVTA